MQWCSRAARRSWPFVFNLHVITVVDDWLTDVRGSRRDRPADSYDKHLQRMWSTRSGNNRSAVCSILILFHCFTGKTRFLKILRSNYADSLDRCVVGSRTTKLNWAGFLSYTYIRGIGTWKTVKKQVNIVTVMSFNHFNESRDYLYTSAGGRNKLWTAMSIFATI